MRIDYKHPAANRVKIFLNGQDVTTLTVEADTDAGWVDMVLRDVEGQVILGTTGKPVLIRVNGNVQIQFKETWMCTFCGVKFDTVAAWARHLAAPHRENN